MSGPRPLDKLIPQKGGCPHLLARWVLRTTKSTATYPDGAERPTELRGGKMQRAGAPCVYAPDHAIRHRTEDGREWT